MSGKAQPALCAICGLYLTTLLAYAQLRPQVTPEPPKPPAPKPTQIVIQTSPNAEIYLDDVRQGEASPEGRLVIDNPTPGRHALRISLTGKKDYQRNVNVAAGQLVKVSAVLQDTPKPEAPRPAAKPATLVIQTSPNSQVYLDDSFNGEASPEGRLVIDNPTPGRHALRISLTGKKDYQRDVNVAAGQLVKVSAVLQDIPKPEAPKPAAGPATVVIQTSPGAQVYLDDSFKGEASPQGRLVIDNPKAGGHSLRVTHTGKKKYEQQLTVVAGQTANIQAPLADLAGSIRVQTSPGAEVFLDDSSRGTADAGGGLTISDVAPGSHQLRISAQGKKEFRRSVTVVAGQENTTPATLLDVEKPRVEVPKAPATPGPTRLNPKDGLKYVRIPPGTFLMGCSPGDDECFDEEKPAHLVKISQGFWIGQTPVTVGAYKRFALSASHKMPPAPHFNKDWTNENMPIINVTWGDAQAYCGWAGGRLPTEAEWEYAARGGSSEARYGELDSIAWYTANSGLQTHDVAQKRPNGFGLYDTLGNVWQWVNDWYDQNYYQGSPGQDPQGPSSGQLHVLRGGSWLEDSRNVRVSYRNRYYPAVRSLVNGFRCIGKTGMP